MQGRMFKGGEERKKKRSLDLTWVGLSCRPAFKILPSIKSTGLYSLCILTEE